MTLVKWNPRQRMLNPFEDWDHFLNEFFGDWEQEDTLRHSWAPAVDIHEDDDQYLVEAELPGMNKKDIHLSVKDNILTIKGERVSEKKDKKENCLRMERSYGSFQRSFRLPEQVKEDKINANFKEGVLTIQIPKTEEVKAKEVEIKVS